MKNVDSAIAVFGLCYLCANMQPERLDNVWVFIVGVVAVGVSFAIFTDNSK